MCSSKIFVRQFLHKASANPPPPHPPPLAHSGWSETLIQNHSQTQGLQPPQCRDGCQATLLEILEINLGVKLTTTSY